MTNLSIEVPKGFLEAEIRNDFQVTTERKQVWAVLIDLLNQFSVLCDTLHVSWWVDAGTILGAVRHKGFIPWDDDIDVIMRREDYEILCKKAPTMLRHPYFFQTEETDPGSLRGHAQLRNSNTTGMLISEKSKGYTFNQGIFLDIFPIDGLPKGEHERAHLFSKLDLNKRKAQTYWRYANNYSFPKSLSFIERVKAWGMYTAVNSPVIKWHYNYKKYYSVFEGLAKLYPFENCDEVAKLVLTPIKPRRIWKRIWLEDTTWLPFEFIKVPVPKGHIALLDTFYGDWQTPKQINATHGDVFFDVDKPYTAYINET